MELFVCNFYSGWIAIIVDGGLYAKASNSSRVCDDIENGFEGTKRFVVAVLGDVAKESMFNSIPLTCVW